MKHYKININRDAISSDEIAKGKNFQAVLNGAKMVQKPFYKTQWFMANSIIAVVAVSAIVGYLAIAEKPVDTNEYVKTPNCINPPFKTADIPFETYTINADSGKTIFISNGTTISIPKHVFVDKNGKPIAGSVEIKYREFFDKPEIFLAGIPMKYDSAGVQNTLESAGMIEIRGFKDGKEIFVAPKQSIQISFVSKQPETDYNLYKLDTTARNWMYRGKDKVTATSVQETDTAITKTSIDENEITPNLAATDEVLKSIQTHIATIEKSKPIAPVKAHANKWNFNIEVDPKEFTEVSTYKNTMWEVNESKQKFNPAHEKVLWEDVTISKNENAYVIQFTKGKQTIEYVVNPVYEGKNYVAAKKIYDEKFLDYSTKLADRKLAEKLRMETLQKEFEERKKQQAIKKQQWEQNLATTLVITRSFNIDGFGIWNCDRIAKENDKYKTSNVVFVDSSGNNVILNFVYSVDKRRNALFALNPYYYDKYKVSYEISYNPKNNNMIWAVTSDNKLAILTTDSFNEAFENLGQKNRVTLRIIDTEIKCPADFKKLYDANFEI